MGPGRGMVTWGASVCGSGRGSSRSGGRTKAPTRWDDEVVRTVVPSAVLDAAG